MTIDTDPSAIILPLRAESIEVSKRQVETGRVRVSVETHTSRKTVTESLAHTTVDVERVKVGTMSDTMPEPREEGDVLIIPVVEEVLVRRFLVTEEVRIRRSHHEEPFSEDVTLRHQTVTVIREPAAAEVAPLE